MGAGGGAELPGGGACPKLPVDPCGPYRVSLSLAEASLAWMGSGWGGKGKQSKAPRRAVIYYGLLRKGQSSPDKAKA